MQLNFRDMKVLKLSVWESNRKSVRPSLCTRWMEW